MRIDFEKWQGCQNDFIVVYVDEQANYTLDALKRQAPQLCARNGVGIAADGLIVLHTSRSREQGAQKVTVINQDGSIAKNCGNGLRCAAASLLRYQAQNQRGPQEIIDFELNIEGLSVFAKTLKQKHPHYFFSLDMGPVQLDEENEWQAPLLTKVKSVDPSFARAELHTATVGNRHLVVKTDKAVDGALALTLLAAVKDFAVNVHCIQADESTEQDRQRAFNEVSVGIDELYKARSFENGVGETQACGSGATAIGALAFASGLVERDSAVAVDMPGGRLYIQQSEEGGSVSLAGPARFVFSGTVEI